MNRDFNEFKNFIKGKKVAVVGIGVSNKPLITFLTDLGANVTGFDKKSKEQLGEIASILENKNVKLMLGENYLDKLTGYDVVFKTPSMRIDHPALVNAKNEGAYITSEMEEFIRYCPAKIFAVTGSDGKTTTTTLIYNMLRTEGYRTWIGGNIGNPLFQDIEKISKEDKVVLELSSFQLMTINEPMEVSLITNLAPNHLDIHKDMQEYIDCKKNIFKFKRNNDLTVLNMDNNITNKMVSEVSGKVIQFSRLNELTLGGCFKNNTLYYNNQKICSLEDIKLKGMHNVENLLAAFCCTGEDISIESMKKVAISFTGVEHRMEFVKEIDKVKYYNDSIASSPTRTIAGLEAFNKPVILIAGGYDKKISFEPLAKNGIKYIKTLILMGNTKDKIKKAFDDELKNSNIKLPIIIVDSLEEAVNKAKSIAKENDIVTLSPACASFDMFANFEVRGNKFKDIVNTLK